MIDKLSTMSAVVICLTPTGCLVGTQSTALLFEGEVTETDGEFQISGTLYLNNAVEDAFFRNIKLVITDENRAVLKELAIGNMNSSRVSVPVNITVTGTPKYGLVKVDEVESSRPYHVDGFRYEDGQLQTYSDYNASY
jgi:hypothetical protein